MAALPESFVVTVDKGGGEMVELTLSKHSVRPPNFRILSWDSVNGHVVEHDASNPALPARTYRGYVTQNPNELVLAAIHSDNTISAEAHDGSGKLWGISNVDVTAELANGTATVPAPAPLALGSGTPVAANLPGQFLPPVGLYQAHGVEDVPSKFYDLNGQSLEETMVYLESQWNILDFFNARDTKLSMQLTEVIIRKEQFYTPTAGNAGEFNSALHAEWIAQGQNKRGFIHSWFPYNYTYAGGYSSGNSYYNAGGHNICVNALYHEVAHGWRAQHYFYGKETMTGSHPAHTEMNTQRVLYTRQVEIDQDDGIELLTSYPTNLHPRAYQDVASTSENTAVNISPLANDYDANGDVISIKSFDTTTAKGGTVTESGGVLTYTPAAGYVGKDVIVYAVQDAAGLFTKAAIHVEVINHGLAAQWSMEETSGTSAADGSGNTHTGTLVGADFSSDSVTGPVGNAIALSAGSYIIGDNSNLITGTDTVYPLDDAASNFFDPMDQSFTATTWFKLAPGSDSVTLFSKRNNAALGFILSANTSSGLSTTVKPWDGLQAASSVSGGTVAGDTWYHAAMVINRTDNTLRLFLNGAEVGTAASLPADFYIFNGREDLKIGGGDALFLDEAQIYTKALSLSEIQTLQGVGAVPAGQASPSNATLNLSADTDIEWVAGRASYQHDVYFGTDEAAVAAATTASPEYRGRQSATSFDPGTLSYGQNYFWRIDEIDGSTTIGGSVWRFSTAASAISENLVLHLSMDYADVQTADGVTHTFDDTALPSQDFTNMSVAPGMAGVIGQAGDFSGSADTLRSTVTNAVNRPATGGVTISFWINTTSTESNKKIYDGGGAFFMRYSNGDIQTVFDGSSAGAITFDTNLNDGQWHHVVAHNDGANLTTIYVDGVSVGTQAEGLYDIAALKRSFSIGANYSTATSENLDAAIDDFAVWERALSTTEITAIHAAGLAGNSFSDVPVLANTSFEVSDGFTGFTVGGLKALGTTTDNNGVVWTGVSDSQIWNRTDIAPAGVQVLALGVGGSNGQTDISLPGNNHGVGSVSFDYASFSGTTNVSFKLLYNDNTGSGWVEAWSTQIIGNNPNFSTKPWGSAEVALNIPGDVDLRFETSGNKGALIDNVRITGLINIAPVVNDNAGSIAEGASTGAAVATVTSTDSNFGDSVSYAITAGNTGNVFAINPSTGEITTAAAIDFETTESYSLTITGTDNGGLTDTGTVTVTVTNVNEAPTANDNSGSLAENTSAGSAIATVSTSDPDANDSLSYAITAGNGNGLFAVDSNGNITTTAALDFETAAQHVLTVTVTDAGSLTDTATITVTVTNVNEAPNAADSAGSLAENAATGSAVATVTTTDPDAGDSVSYAITGGNTSGVFAIDASGNIMTTTALDFETAASYALTVTATDGGGLSDTANVVVAVTNVNEAIVANDASGTLAENAAIGSAVATVTTTDPDAGDSVSYAITGGNTGGAFAIDASGNITTTTALDFETTASYALTVTATDGGGLSDTANVAVTVTNSNEAPVFAVDPINASNATDAVAYSGTLAGSASDEDAGTSLSYSKTAGPAWLVVASDGTLSGTPTSSDTGANVFTVQVDDADGGTASATLNITVDAASGTLFSDDFERAAGSTIGNGWVEETNDSRIYDTAQAASKMMISVSAGSPFAIVNPLTNTYVDGDRYEVTWNASRATSANGTLVYDASIGTWDGTTFTPLASQAGSMNSLNIQGKVAGPSVYTTATAAEAGLPIAIRFEVLAGSSDWAGFDDIAVNALGANQAPVANDSSGSVAEDVAVGTAVATVSVSDADAGDSLSYAITGGNTGNAFAIDNTGAITTATALDYETTASYSLTVTATDTGNLSDTAAVTVTVSDVFEVTAPAVATGSASGFTQTSADIAYTVSDDGGEAPTVTVYYGATDGGTTPANWENSSNQAVQATGAHSATLSGLTEGTDYYFTVLASNSAGDAWGSTASFTTEADTSPKLVRTLVSNVGSTSWTQVNLGQNYNSAVIVATPIYADSNVVPMVTRIRNISGSSFEVKIDRADGLTANITTDVSIIAVEEGVYTQATDGVTMEAVKYTSTVTAENSNWVAEARTYQNTYTAPVVVGQVMSANDANWSTFWSQGSSRTEPASAGSISVGKHVGEDALVTRANETIGYIVIESGSGSINGVNYTAGLGADTIRGIGNTSTGYDYTLSGISTASAAAVSIAGMDGADGGWPVLYGATPMTSTTLTLAIDEDQLGNTERSHTTEQVGYIVFE